MKPVLYSLDPAGHTGGRVYLQMVHQVLAGSFTINTIPDFKRTYPARRWRKLRHLARISLPVSATRRNHDALYLWDDLSLVLFSPAMRRRTVFLLHHYEPLQADSDPLESRLWHCLFAALRDCAAVVTVAPYWRRFLAARGVTATVIYNAFDMDEVAAARMADPAACKARFGLDPCRLTIYAGKAAHWKGADQIAQILAPHPEVCVVTSGSNKTGAATRHFQRLPRTDYLRLIRACDAGVFASVMVEGWSRCAAEAILLDVPCLIKPTAGLGDLARLTQQPAPNLDRLAAHLAARADTSLQERRAARLALARYDTSYFAGEWETLMRDVSRATARLPCRSGQVSACDPALRETQTAATRPCAR